MNARNEREAFQDLEATADQARRTGCWQSEDEIRGRHDAVQGILIACGLGCVLWALAFALGVFL